MYTIPKTKHDLNFQVSRKPYGRFLSFDAKRSLFSGKRLAEDADDSPTGKRLREAEAGINDVSLQVNMAHFFLKYHCLINTNNI
jgi:hypothetical protein